MKYPIGNASVSFVYRNHRGLTETRRVRPEFLYFGTTEYHKTPGWLLDAYDHDRGAIRTFSIPDIQSPWTPIPEDQHDTDQRHPAYQTEESKMMRPRPF